MDRLAQFPLKRSVRNAFLVFVVLVSLAMHWQHFPKELVSIHVWRQTQTQSTIINFYEGDMNILNPARNDRGNGDGIYRMEFPMAQWIVAAVYKVFGNHLVLSRLTMFIFGLFTMAGMWRLLTALFRSEIPALAGVWAFTFSPSFFYYTINPLPDNLALCFGAWGLALFFTWIRNQRMMYLFLSGLMLGLGALCKLPFILYFAVPAAWQLHGIFMQGIQPKRKVREMVVFLFLALPVAWYAWVVPHWDTTGIIGGMAANRTPMATILDYLVFNLVSTLPELLLNYGSLPLFLAGFWFLFRNKPYSDPRFKMLALTALALIAYFLYEVNMIAQVHDYYLFPFLPLLFIVVAYGASNLVALKNRYGQYVVIFLLLLLPFTAWLRMAVRWNEDSPGFNKDLLVYKQDLRNAVPGNALCVAGNDQSHYIFFYYIGKKGWGFDNDSISGEQLRTMIGQGAKFLYSDSRTLDGRTDILACIDTLVIEKGSVRVYRLKDMHAKN